ncbi:hypothetical protein [Chryseobacterium foetidum]|uniref:hypothetical protein n=1 Tax=Chryseobacterium foetidum TaxID=2951057 RepID=UPI0021C6517C|nr:hypothetical protein [Chryseobacterium foetidum]
MKKILITITLGASLITYSQIRIGGTNSITGLTNDTSVLLEFGTDNNKGIILPYVETVPTGANNSKGGTMIFDVSANGQYKVKVKNENSGWTDLSGQSGYSTAVANIVKTPQALLTDNPEAKAIIGNSSTTTEGVLVLDSPDKAMILPIVSDYTAIKDPSPGMIAFLKGTTSDKHRLIVFNGVQWSFWKP